VKLPDAALNLQWRLLIALARLAGLRIPSESHILTWDCVDWERRRLRGYAPKTGSTRFVPIVAELFDLLSDAFNVAPEGQTKIISFSRNNLHRDFGMIILRAGFEPWEDRWQTLRRSAETMFAQKHPQYAVSQWLGHSMAVSDKHYGQAPDPVHELATTERALAAAESAAVRPGTGSQSIATVQYDDELDFVSAQTKTRTSHTLATECGLLPEVGRGGFEPPTPGFSVLCSTN